MSQMVPFLYNDTFSLLQQTLQTVVKPDLLINCKEFGDLMKLDLDKKKYIYEVERYEYWVLNHIYNYQARRNRSDQQCSDFIFLQWRFQFVSTTAKKLFE